MQWQGLLGSGEAGSAPVQGVELVWLDGRAAWLGHDAPVQRGVLLRQRVKLGRAVRLPRRAPASVRCNIECIMCYWRQDVAAWTLDFFK
jgi:hypothetical protein